jgi:hypothetical protein
MFYPGENKNNVVGDGRGLAGPIATIRMKNWRRGQQDYEYLVAAQRAGLNTALIVNSIVSAALSETNGQPPVQWAENGYKYENARRQLAELITGGAAYGVSNAVSNPGFESGTASWNFYTNGVGDFAVGSPGYGSSQSAKLTITQTGTNTQLFQSGISLEPKTAYRLSFAARSNTGHDFDVSVMKHGPPYDSYGLSLYRVDLAPSWDLFSVDFVTDNFTSAVADARLMFWITQYAAAGDQFEIDDIVLDRVSVAPGPMSVSSQNGEPPREYVLSQNYPNPFNPSTVINYKLPATSHVTLKVFDVLGREVASLVDGEQGVGSHDVRFDASRLASGTYFYRLQTAYFGQTQKMMIAK